MCQCTCLPKGSGSDRGCPVHHPQKGVNGNGKPLYVRTHASDRNLPAEKKQRRSGGKNLGLLLSESEEE